ncbi:ERCC4-related helicase [Flavobacterium sp. 7E]|uniref:DEAD/DEAH box helicase n=1 Tax=Flavobacterium sp. 7E TaxID=2735898 RepID=UPI00156FC480|nr:SNF2-related protein [Flavobacterium sp. 7E]NRS89626.1 ERCC4-related helicase [Flavobacterium sp. 7E]
MDIKTIKKYIKLHSNPNSRSNSHYVYPILLEHSTTAFQFECEGQYGEYVINVKLNDAIETSCSCPYKKSYSGICKHVIASLKIIIEDYSDEIENPVLKNKEQTRFEDLGDEKTTKRKINEIQLIDGVISSLIIKNWTVAPKHRGFYYNDLKIKTASQTEVTTKSSGWDTCEQVFKYNPETEILEFECSCSKTKKVCEHIGTSLAEIVGVFGHDLFSKKYFDTKIQEAIAAYDFTLEDDYHSIFNFSLTPKGFQAKPKIKNMITDSRDFSRIFKDENDDATVYLPNPKTNDNEFGLGVYFEFQRKTFEGVTLFQAKYNKNRTDFSSSITLINTYNFEDALTIYSSNEEQFLLTKSIQINKSLSKYKSSKDIGFLKKAIDSNQEFLQVVQKKLSYTYDNAKSLVRKNLVPCIFEDKTIKLFFTLTETNYFYTLKAKISLDDKNYNLNASAIQISHLYIFIDNVIIPIKDTRLSLYLNHYSSLAEINYLKKDTPDFFEKILYPLSKKFEVQTTIFKKSKEKTTDDDLEKQVYLTDHIGEFITFKLAVKYPNQLVEVQSSEMLFDKETNRYQERNQSFEDNFLEEFKQLHSTFETQEELFYLTPDELFENYWMLHSIERMKQLGITVFGANDLKSFKFNLNKAVIRVNLKSDIDWFDIEIDISFGNQKVNIKELQKAFLKKANYMTLGDGTLGILPEEWMKKFANYFKTGEIKKNGIQISNYQFGIIDELYEELENKPTFLEELYNKKLRLQNISEIEPIAIPKGIKAKLRDYQHHGLNWLAFLDKNQLGGCLADDMGLGKTLQTIAFLQHLKITNPKNQPSLIIAPTSLIFNWKNEIEKFCPTLKLLTFTGSNRLENKDNFNKYDLIISTYGSLLNDIEFLKDFKFHYVVLDESQAIKNPNSKRYKAVRLLHSYNKIALTGTPIENNTFDLYAQLNFLNPGLLGNMSHFKTNFSDAIDKEKDVDASLLLGKIIAPFMLRRTKEQVATELPEKTESIIFCEMEKEQRKVYDTFKNKYRDYLLNKIDENGVEKSQMYILDGLTKLRQICNSTALIPSEEDFGNYSVKLESLIENIKEKTGNHKILVFSQFVKMLQIVKTRLEEEHITFEYLDGQTTNRQDRVENFQNNAAVRVFLISLKAGGTGLNLTEADYVFIIDPWWNPAVENQAIDRCYRIGQTKKVMAYRMICKDTIEEKIVSLQQKKKNVASSIISIDDEKKSFDINEVKELFK